MKNMLKHLVGSMLGCKITSRTKGTMNKYISGDFFSADFWQTLTANKNSLKDFQIICRPEPTLDFRNQPLMDKIDTHSMDGVKY